MIFQIVLGQPPEPDNQAKYREFRQLTGQFQKDVTTAQRIGDASEVPALLNIYTTEVLEIFPDGPDTIPELVADYKADVGKVLGPCYFHQVYFTRSIILKHD